MNLKFKSLLFNNWFRSQKIFLSTVSLFLTAFLFQNCSGKLQSNAGKDFLNLSSSVPAEPQPETPDEKNNPYVDCKIPEYPVIHLSKTCLPVAMEKARRLGQLENFEEYIPRYPLYSDGAEKRRWILYPRGAKIDSKDPDNWVFPKGTVMFKQFSILGQVIETRMMEKINEGTGFSSWRFSVFAERKDGKDADQVMTDTFLDEITLADLYNASSVKNIYKIGTPGTCMQCHAGVGDVVRGFNYLQLSTLDHSVNIDYLKKINLLTVPPLKFDEIPGTFLDRSAIGYIQTNCATCHDGTVRTGSGPGSFLHLSTSQVLEDEPIMKRAAVRVNLINPSFPETSLLYLRFQSGIMPKIPLVQKDLISIALIEEWIKTMPPRPPPPSN